MKFDVILHKEKNENLPYIIREIKAENEKEAIQKAKEFVANNAYWGSINLSKQTKFKQLTVENVVLSK